MYFSRVASKSVREMMKAHDELRTTIPGLDREVIGGLFGDDVGDQYADLFYEINLGSALASRDIIGISWTILRKNEVVPAINIAVAGLITSSWYSLKYPVIGGALQWGAGLPIVGGAIAGWFGPPAALVQAGAFGAALAVLYPANKLVRGFKTKWNRAKEIKYAKLVVPVLVATAEADGNISVEELRLLRDVLCALPRDESFDPRARTEELLKQDAAEQAKKVATEISISEKQQDRIVELGILMALADNHFDGRERYFLNEIAEIFEDNRRLVDQAKGIVGSSSSDFDERAKELEEEVEKELHLAKAGLRVLHAIALVDGQLEEDAAELMDMTLMNLVGPEIERERIVSRLGDGSKEKLYSKTKLLHPFPEMKTGLFTRLDPRKECAQERAINYVINQGVAFIHTLEIIRDEALHFHRAKLNEIAEKYDMPADEVEERRKEYAEKLEETQKRRKKHEGKVGECPCPNCGEVGNFEVSEKRYLTRNEYACTECKQKTLLCRMPKCKNMSLAGDFYSEELCEEHTPF